MTEAGMGKKRDAWLFVAEILREFNERTLRGSDRDTALAGLEFRKEIDLDGYEPDFNLVKYECDACRLRESDVYWPWHKKYYCMPCFADKED